MSIAPRTDDPTRRSGWVRVRRTSSTTLSTQRRIEVVGARRPAGDVALVARRLVADGEATDPVVHRSRDAGGADRVERVHRRHQAEAGRRGQPTEPWHVEFALAHHGDEHVQRLLGDAVDLLDVQQRPVAQRRRERTVDEHVRVVALGHHPGRIEVADEPGRGEFGVALDELETDAQLEGDGAQQRRLAGAGRPLDEDVAVGDERGDDEFDLAATADDGRPDAIDERRRVGGRVRHAVSSCSGQEPCTITPRMFSPSRIAW